MNNNNDKQKLLLEYLISSADTFALCKSIIQSDYFDPEFRKTVDFLNTYYDKYSATPNPDQIHAETGVKLKLRQVTHDEIKYCSEEVEGFCKQGALEFAVREGMKHLKNGDGGKIESLIREAMSVSLTQNLGLSYFSNPAKRLKDRAAKPLRTPTGWKQVDEMLSGGLARTEMILFSANSGGGKSIALANLAHNFLKQGLNVLYISLELSEEMIAERFDSIITGTPAIVCTQQTHNDEIAMSLDKMSAKMGNLQIVRLPSATNANGIRAYLKELELKQGYLPDLLVVDYLDKMGTNEKVSADNISEKDKLASEQLNDIGFDYNMFIATASQQNRSALDAQELHQGHIAGGLSKFNAVDWAISIILTPTMRAAGEIGFNFLKTRSSDGVGKTVFLQWEGKILRITNPKEENNSRDNIIINKLDSLKGAGGSKRPSLLDVMEL